jgi:hypothetical protein
MDRDRQRDRYLGREGYGTERGTRWRTGGGRGTGGDGKGTGPEKVKDGKIKSMAFTVEMVHC